MNDFAAVTKIERRTSGEQLAHQLRKEIIAGRLKAGDRVQQEEVAARYGVSRTPVREALLILESEGRIRLEPHKGAFVLPMDAESIRDNTEIFGMIFGYMARRAAERRTVELEDRLASIADALRAATVPTDVWRIVELYLDAVIEVGVAPRMAHAIRRMRSIGVDTLFDVAPEAAEVTRVGTLELIDAICAGDGDRAEAIQRETQRRSADIIIESFEARSVLGEVAGA